MSREWKVDSMENEVQEKLIILQDQITNGRIEAVAMARFCAAVYEILGDNYDEELFVRVNKRIMNFFNHGMKNIVSPDVLESTDNIKEGCAKKKAEILKKLEINSLDMIAIPYKEIELDNTMKEYVDFGKEYNRIISENKPGFLRFFKKKKWRNNLKQLYAKIEGFEEAIDNAIVNEVEKEERKELLKEKEDIVEDIKKLLAGYNDEIGMELAGWSFETILSDEGELKQYVGGGLLPELAGFAVNKNK